MSVTFNVVGLSLDIEDQMDYNFANGNAVDLLFHLNIEPYTEYGLTGEIRTHELRKKLEDFLANPEPERREQYINGNLIQCADTRGHHSRAQKLLELCHRAGDLGMIYWS